MAKKVAVGLIQMKCTESSDQNLENAIKNIKDAAQRGAQIVSVSELFLSPYFCQVKDNKFFNLAEAVPGPTTNTLAEVAKTHHVALIVSVFEKAEGKFFNTAVVIDADGKISGKYRKMHIPDDPANGYDEAYYFEKGDLGFQAFETAYAKVGPMVCYDQWFPEGARVIALQGAQILFYPTAIGWPSHVRPELNKAEHEAWQIMHRSHAIANNIFVVAVNRVGKEENINFWGTSFVSDPYGRVIAMAPTDAEVNLIAECDLDLTDSMRKDWPFLNDYRKLL